MPTSAIALVTGAGSGIGRASALALARAGFTVVLAGRRRAALEATAALGDVDAPRMHSMPTDVADATAVAQLFQYIEATFGRLDLLFNNAGMGSRTVPIDELSIAEWRQVVDVNLTGAFLCAREAFRLMRSQRPQGGRIINNGSISAHAPRPMSAPYTATKHAITGLTKSLALDGRAFDIACCQIDIGNADTELAARMRQGVPQADGRIAAEPTMDVDHVASAIAYMAGLPLAANVQFMTIMATKMPFIGRG
jgi:NAD(P)-dependent dehydrogenase (short-subunit alcohol dehydrogenase family)